MAERIQRKRVKGWKMPEGAVYVGRPTKWGNPYHIGENYSDEILDEQKEIIDILSWDNISAETAVRFYLEAIQGSFPCLPFTIDDVRRELAGKDLVCWCPIGQPCHADVLLRLANTQSTGQPPAAGD